MSDPSEVRETYECGTVPEKNPDFEVYYRGEGVSTYEQKYTSCLLFVYKKHAFVLSVSRTQPDKWRFVLEAYVCILSCILYKLFYCQYLLPSIVPYISLMDQLKHSPPSKLFTKGCGLLRGRCSNSLFSNGGSGGAEPPRLASDGLGFESGVFGKCPEALDCKEQGGNATLIRKNAMLLRLIIKTQQLTAITWRSFLRFKASGHFPKTPDSNPNPSDANV